jgi:hypothetical protein
MATYCTVRACRQLRVNRKWQGSLLHQFLLRAQIGNHRPRIPGNSFDSSDIMSNCRSSVPGGSGTFTTMWGKYRIRNTGQNDLFDDFFP